MDILLLWKLQFYLESILKDYCLFWGLPGIAILAVSLFVAVRMSQDFAHDGFVKFITFIGCNIFLWLVYILIQSVLQDILLFPSLKSRSTLNNIREKVGEEERSAVMQDIPEDTIEPKTSAEAAVEITEEPAADESEAANAEEPVVISDEEESVPVTEELHKQEPAEPAIPSVISSTDPYIIQRMRILELEKKRNERKAAVRQAVADYVPYALAPYVRKEEMDGVIRDVIAWTEDETRKPQPVSVTEQNSATSIDLRHFIRNINIRLESRRSGESCAQFLQALFPSIFGDMSLGSIRNFTAKASGGGLIPIDEPDGDDFAFHYETASEEPSETDNNEEND